MDQAKGKEVMKKSRKRERCGLRGRGENRNKGGRGMMIKPQRVGENTLSRRGTRGSWTRGSCHTKKRVGGSMTSFCPHTFLPNTINIYLSWCDGLSKYKFLILHSGILIFKWDNLVSPRAYHFHAPLLSLLIIGLNIHPVWPRVIFTQITPQKSPHWSRPRTN